MVIGFKQVVSLLDLIGNVDCVWCNEVGLMIVKEWVLLGVIGMIFEVCFNVMVDVLVLCFKIGNVVILCGGKEVFYFN